MDKWTPELWLSSTEAEVYEGTEDITSPAARELLVQAGLIQSSSTTTSAPSSTPGSHLDILDNGAGIAQLTEILLDQPGLRGSKIVCGDIDESLLEAVRRKAKKNRWENVEVKKIDTHVSAAPHIHRKGDCRNDCSGRQAMDIPDTQFTHIFGSFIYMLLPDPITALKGMSPIGLPRPPHRNFML